MPKKKYKGHGFVISCGAIPDEIMVFYELSHKDALKEAERLRIKKDFIQAIQECESLWDKGDARTIRLHDGEGNETTVIVFNDVRGKDVLPTLVHETSHAVDYICEYRAAQKEPEFRAYLTEYIFKCMYDELP